MQHPAVPNLETPLAAVRPDLDALAQTEVAREPYPHFVVPGFLSPDDVARINRDFPDLGAGGLFVPQNARGAFGALIEALLSPALRDLLAQKLDVDLSAAAPLLTVRGRCQRRDGRIHADAAFKITTALLYLNESWDSPEGRLRILRSRHDIRDYAVEVPPEAGLLACFRVQKNSWHGHTPYEGDRRYVMLNYCDSRRTRDREIMRHALSGQWKRARRALLGAS